VHELDDEPGVACRVDGRGDLRPAVLLRVVVQPRDDPGLPRRLREGAPLNEPVRDTFYGGGPEGYTDCPALDAAAA